MLKTTSTGTGESPIGCGVSSTPVQESTAAASRFRIVSFLMVFIMIVL